MTSLNIEKYLGYLNIQERLRSENLTEYCLCKGIFYVIFSTLKDMQTQNKTNH